MTRVAVLDDWQGIAREVRRLVGAERAKAELVFFRDAFADEDAAAAAARRFRGAGGDARAHRISGQSDRQTAETAHDLGMTGGRARTLDIAACTTRGVLVCNTGGGAQSSATAELALGLMLAAFRRIPAGDAGIRAGRFQDGIVPRDRAGGAHARA